MSEQLTVKEAIEQGYTHYGYDNGGFQHLSTLEDISPADLEESEWRGGHPVLAQKEPFFMSISADDVRDNVTDHICDQEEYMDDSGTIEDALKEMDIWEGFAAKINDTLKKHPYWYLTEIKLIP